MSDERDRPVLPDDAEVLDEAFATFGEELEPLVPGVVTVPDGVATDEAEAWAVQVFQFGFALGAVTGARVVTDAAESGDDDEPRFTAARVDAIVDDATDAIARHEVYDESLFRG